MPWWVIVALGLAGLVAWLFPFVISSPVYAWRAYRAIGTLKTAHHKQVRAYKILGTRRIVFKNLGLEFAEMGGGIYCWDTINDDLYFSSLNMDLGYALIQNRLISEFDKVYRRVYTGG